MLDIRSIMIIKTELGWTGGLLVLQITSAMRSTRLHVEQEPLENEILIFDSGPTSLAKTTWPKVHLQISLSVHQREPGVTTTRKDSGLTRLRFQGVIVADSSIQEC